MKGMTGIYRINPALFGGILGGCTGLIITMLLPLQYINDRNILLDVKKSIFIALLFIVINKRKKVTQWLKYLIRCRTVKLIK